MMKKRLLSVVLLTGLLTAVFFATGCGRKPHKYYVSFNSVAELQNYFHWKPDRKPMVSAHRGGPMPGYPENCIETFDHVLNYAPAVLECDVRKTKDGRLVMMHDETLDRTTTGTGRVIDHTLAELESLRLKDNAGKVTPYRIPLFDDVLEWGRGKAVLELDIKRPVTPEEIIAKLKQHDAFAYSVVITYSNASAMYYHQLSPELVISASAGTPRGVAGLDSTGIPAKNLIVFVGVTEPDTSVYRMLHRRGISAILGTLGNLDRRAAKRGLGVYLQFLRHGADILATDNIPMAVRAIYKFVEQRKRAAESIQ